MAADVPFCVPDRRLGGWSIYLGVMFVMLLIIIILFLAKDMMLYSIHQTYNNALAAAENAPGFCGDGNAVCVWQANDTLGIPASPIFDFSRTTALIMIDLVGRMGNAARSDTVVSSPPGFRLVDSLVPSTGPVFTGVWITEEAGKKNLYIAFRGTHTREEWNRDFQTTQQGVVPGELKKGRPRAQNIWSGRAQIANSEAVRVHSGFLSLFKEFEPALAGIIEQEKPDQIFVGGHSLGAGVATLTGLQFFNDAPLVVYAFGSPRVGNVAFARAVDENFTLFRVSNQADVINDMPLAVMFNLNGDHQPFIYDQAGTNQSFNLNWGSWQNNHGLPIHIFCLETDTCHLTPVDWT
jgi:hypothetical protein